MIVLVSDLADELQALVAEPVTIKSMCNTALVLSQMDDDDRATLNALLDNPHVSTPRIASVLLKWGYRVGDDSLLRHRNRGKGGGCKCPR